MEGGDGARANEDWQSFLSCVLGRIGVGVLAVGGALAFVAAVGGAIAWTRFRAVELPADQALDKLPQGELVATGAVTLALYGVLGVLATVAVYLIDGPTSPTDGTPAPDDEPAERADAAEKEKPQQQNRRSRGRSRGLLVLVAVETIVVAALLIPERGWERFAICVELVAAILLYCLLITRALRAGRSSRSTIGTTSRRGRREGLRSAVPLRSPHGR